MKPKLLLINHTSELTGGAEADFERLLKHLSQSGKYDIHALFPDGPRKNQFSKYCSKFGFFKWGIFPVVYENVLSYLKYFIKFFVQAYQIHKFTRGNKYDLCMTNVVVLVWPVIVMKLKKSKTIVLVKEKVEPAFARNIVMFILGFFTDIFITNNETLRTDILSGYNKNIDVRCIYPAIENINIKSKSKSEDSINDSVLKKLKKDNSFKLLSVGGINIRKNQLLILETIILLKKNEPKIPVEVYFVGNFDFKVGYAKKVYDFYLNKSLENECFFLGELSRSLYLELYNYIDASIISSTSEGLPIFLAESMLNKRPVISTKVGGIPEIIKHGFNGMLAELNPQSLADAILKLAGNKSLYNIIAHNSYNTYTENFDMESNMKKLEDVIEKII